MCLRGGCGNRSVYNNSVYLSGLIFCRPIPGVIMSSCPVSLIARVFKQMVMKIYLLSAFLLLPFCKIMAQDEPPYESIPALRQRLAVVHDDTARVRLQLDLAYAYTRGNERSNHNLDTAQALLSEVKRAGSIRADGRLQGLFHFTTAVVFREKDNHDSSIHHALLAVDLLPAATMDWAKACVEVGYNYSHTDPYEDSLRGVWFEKAMPVFAALSNSYGKEWYGHTLMCLAQCRKFKPAESIAMYHKAEDIWKSAGHHDCRNIHGQMGGTYASMGDQVQALHYALLAVREDELLARPDALTATIYNQLGYCYYQQGNSKEALPCFRKSFYLVMQLGDTSTISSITSNLVSIYIDLKDFPNALTIRRQSSAFFPPRTLQGRLLETENYAIIFAKMQQPDSMRPYVEKLMKFETLVPPNSVLRFRVVRVGSTYYNMIHQYAQGRKYAAEMVRISGTLGLVAATYLGYRDLAQADSGLGNYKAAMAEYEKYIAMQDSMRDDKSAKQVASLKLQYETEKKDKDILALQHKQELSQLTLGRNNLIRNFIIAGAILLLILLLVSINRYRLKQRSNNQLSHLLEEKEWLLKEIHHRVKNNLQIVMSLLSSQSAYIDNETALSAIQASRHRVYAMSLIHQKLYNSENVSSIDMSFYTRELVSYLRDSFTTGQRIRFELDIQPVVLDVGQAVPLGLILNEAITNAIKYAFPDDRAGVISVSLANTSPRRYLLVIADDGVGIPDQDGTIRNGSLGMSLIRGLSNSLDGNVIVENKNGTVIKIAFLAEPVQVRHFTNVTNGLPFSTT